VYNISINNFSKEEESVMRKRLSVLATTRAHNVQQAYVLILLGIVFLALAWLINLNPYAVPVGVFLFGVGMLVASLLNPSRLASAGWLTTFLGVATFLTFKHLIPGSQILAIHLLAIGLGLLAIAFMARRGYIGAGAVTPALIVVAVGVIEYLLTVNLTPGNFIPFMLSLWLPGCGLLVLGIIYLITSGSALKRFGTGRKAF
jgi:hypothetical protein